MLFAVRHAVLRPPSKFDLIVAREQERLAELVLQFHANIGANGNAQPLEKVSAKAVALGAHQLSRWKWKETKGQKG